MPARPPRCSVDAAVQGGRTIAPVMPLWLRHCRRGVGRKPVAPFPLQFRHRGEERARAAPSFFATLEGEERLFAPPPPERRLWRNGRAHIAHSPSLRRQHLLTDLRWRGGKGKGAGRGGLTATGATRETPAAWVWNRGEARGRRNHRGLDWLGIHTTTGVQTSGERRTNAFATHVQGPNRHQQGKANNESRSIE